MPVSFSKGAEMRIETNNSLVRRNRRLAQYLFFISIAVLVGSFIYVNSQALGGELPQPGTLEGTLYLLLPALVLPFGVISSMISVRMTNHWIRQPRPEEALRVGLKGLSNRSVLYNYLHMPLRHLLICPQGVFAITTRFQNGSYQVDGERWKTQESAFSRFTSFFRRDGIGHPASEARSHADRLQALLPEGIDVRPLIVFVDPAARLEVSDSPVPVLYADSKREPNIRDHLRKIPEQERQPMSVAQIEDFEAATLAG